MSGHILIDETLTEINNTSYAPDDSGDTLKEKDDEDSVPVKGDEEYVLNENEETPVEKADEICVPNDSENTPTEKPGEDSVPSDNKDSGLIPTALKSDMVNKLKLNTGSVFSDVETVEQAEDTNTLTSYTRNSSSAVFDARDPPNDVRHENKLHILRQDSELSLIGYPDEEAEFQRLEALLTAIKLQDEVAQIRRDEFMRRYEELLKRRNILAERQHKNRILILEMATLRKGKDTLNAIR